MERGTEGELEKQYATNKKGKLLVLFVAKKRNVNMKDWQPKILAILCNWCSYAGADLAGVSRMQYPPNVRVIRIPCSGRVDPLFIMKTLQSGFDGLLISG